MNLSISERRALLKRINNPRPKTPEPEKIPLVKPKATMTKRQKMKMKMMDLQEINEIAKFIIDETPSVKDTRKLMHKMCDELEFELDNQLI